MTRSATGPACVDGNGNATIYTYTPWGLPESTIEPATTEPPEPRPTGPGPPSTTPPAGPSSSGCPAAVTRTRTFDNLGRLTGETGTGATTTARSLDYDPLGRVTSATSPAGNHTYTWTDRGLLATATGYGGTATYTYDADAAISPSGSTRPGRRRSATTTPAG